MTDPVWPQAVLFPSAFLNFSLLGKEAEELVEGASGAEGW